jgi:hypothetical protein
LSGFLDFFNNRYNHPGFHRGGHDRLHYRPVTGIYGCAMEKRLGIVIPEVTGATGQQKVNDLAITKPGAPFPQFSHFL